jgi:hypothetical protein
MRSPTPSVRTSTPAQLIGERTLASSTTGVSRAAGRISHRARPANPPTSSPRPSTSRPAARMRPIPRSSRLADVEDPQDPDGDERETEGHPTEQGRRPLRRRRGRPGGAPPPPCGGRLPPTGGGDQTGGTAPPPAGGRLVGLRGAGRRWWDGGRGRATGARGWSVAMAGLRGRGRGRRREGDGGGGGVRPPGACGSVDMGDLRGRCRGRRREGREWWQPAPGPGRRPDRGARPRVVTRTPADARVGRRRATGRARTRSARAGSSTPGLERDREPTVDGERARQQQEGTEQQEADADPEQRVARTHRRVPVDVPARARVAATTVPSSAGISTAATR